MQRNASCRASRPGAVLDRAHRARRRAGPEGCRRADPGGQHHPERTFTGV